ncbi:MAG: dihydrofolate reductase family protein [Devosia sp.]
MATFIYALNQSLDGYVDHMAFAPDPALFAHFIADVEGLAGMIYGRTMYEIMAYWDEDRPEWDEPRWTYARAWRNCPKWVVSTSLSKVGPNATLVSTDVEETLRRLKAERGGLFEVAGPTLVGRLSGTGLIDEYHIYLSPAVTGGGTRYFAVPPPPLRLESTKRFGETAIRLVYVPA